MFYGLVLKPGVPVSIDADLGEVLHISQACLSDPKGNGKTYVKIKESDATFSVCCLQKDTQEFASLDLFLQAATAPTFVAEGTNEVHLIGYWEPNPSLSDEDDDDEMAGLMEGDGVSESDEEDAEEMERFSKKLPNIADIGEDSDEDEDEDDEIEAVAPPVVASKPKALPAGASANKQKPGQKGGDKPQHNKVQQIPQSKAAPKASDGQKRKAADTPAAEPAAKQAKAAAAAAPAKAEGGGEEKFQADLIEYLKKNGRTSMSELGSKVKKPAGVAKKVGVFLKERKDTFKIDGNNVQLAQ